MLDNKTTPNVASEETAYFDQVAILHIHNSSLQYVLGIMKPMIEWPLNNSQDTTVWKSLEATCCWVIWSWKFSGNYSWVMWAIWEEDMYRHPLHLVHYAHYFDSSSIEPDPLQEEVMMHDITGIGHSFQDHYMNLVCITVYLHV